MNNDKRSFALVSPGFGVVAKLQPSLRCML